MGQKLGKGAGEKGTFSSRMFCFRLAFPLAPAPQGVQVYPQLWASNPHPLKLSRYRCFWVWTETIEWGWNLESVAETYRVRLEPVVCDGSCSVRLDPMESE